MHPPKSESVETPEPARRAGGLPTHRRSVSGAGGPVRMNLLNYVDRYSFFAAGTQIQNAP